MFAASTNSMTMAMATPPRVSPAPGRPCHSPPRLRGEDVDVGQGGDGGDEDEFGDGDLRSIDPCRCPARDGLAEHFG
ncbi:hypothetical protein [Nonomuraea basaltis]|uniref:hypothetical protein n=1 Tax=Nonomuraea basaltis TaxID=2495887 RepID=UPI00110C6BD0|nr:hypothetical protein [Nonomuraea basaltis]TMR96613.1 hypothetical protein EJK15_22210 [Nonomuraea basaltis]